MTWPAFGQNFRPISCGAALSLRRRGWQPGGMPRRLIQLFAGLVLYGVSDSMLLLAGLGVDPWDVLHQGLARRTGVPTGTWAIIAGAVVLLLWIPLRQRPGLGTLCNVVLIGAVITAALRLIRRATAARPRPRRPGHHRPPCARSSP